MQQWWRWRWRCVPPHPVSHHRFIAAHQWTNTWTNTINKEMKKLLLISLSWCFSSSMFFYLNSFYVLQIGNNLSKASLSLLNLLLIGSLDSALVFTNSVKVHLTETSVVFEMTNSSLGFSDSFFYRITLFFTVSWILSWFKSVLTKSAVIWSNIKTVKITM